MCSCRLDDPIVWAGRSPVRHGGPAAATRSAGGVRLHRELGPLAVGGRHGGTRSARSRPRRPAPTQRGGCTRERSTSAAGTDSTSGRACQPASRRLCRDGDLVVAVCDNVHEELDPARDRLHWSIPDPVRVDTDEAFETAYADISGRVDRLALAYASSKEAS